MDPSDTEDAAPPARPDFTDEAGPRVGSTRAPGRVRRAFWIMAGVAALGVAVGVPILLATRSTNPAHRTASEATCRDLAQLDQAEAHYQRVVRGGGTLLSAADFEELRALAAEIESAADRLDADVAPLARAGHSSVASRVAALAAEVHLQAGNLNSLINANPHDVSGARADLVAVLSCR